MNEEKETKIFEGKLIKNDMLREGTGWKLYQLIVLGEDSKNHKIGSFNKDYKEFMNKYVKAECTEEHNEKDGKNYTNYTIKEMTELTGEQQTQVKKVVNKSPNDWKREQETKVTDWDAKEKRKMIDNSLVRATGFLQVAKDLGIITKENTKDLAELKSKWFFIADSVLDKIYSGKKEMEKVVDNAKKETVPINEVPVGTNKDDSSVEEELVE